MRRARTSAAGFSAGEDARILAVRAKPTTGGKLGSAQTTGVLVKPCAVRPPITCSSALQTVGVSALRKTASVSGEIVGMYFPPRNRGPRFPATQRPALSRTGERPGLPRHG